MERKINKLEHSHVEVICTVDKENWKKAQDKAFKKLAANVEIKGFRKGKAPENLVRERINHAEVLSNAVDALLPEIYTAIIEEDKIKPYAQPKVDVTKISDDELEVKFVIVTAPSIELGAYQNLKIGKEKAKVTDEQVEAALKDLQEKSATLVVKEGEAKDGDTVVMDFVGTVEGKPFEGGSAENYELVLGSHSFIPGFEDGIVGHEPGDKFDLELTFPKDYGVKDLAGAKTVFEVLVKQINEVKKPAIDDELAKKCGPFKSIDELKEDIKKNLAAQNEHRLGEKFKDDLVNALVKKSTIPAPEILIDDQVRMIRDDMTRNAQSQGLSFEEFLERNSETLESWEKEARKIAEKRVKASLALQTLAVEQKITVSDDLVAAKIAELKDVYKKSPEALKSLKDPNVKMDIKNRMIIEKTLDFLVKENS